jgi:AraC-like DNA-binding protein
MTERGKNRAELSQLESMPPVKGGAFNPDFFKAFQAAYFRRTGYQLVLSDLDGSIRMGLPDCDKFPCMRSCRECRESIFREAIRTHQVCMDDCHEGYVIWGLPVVNAGQLVGGLVVIGGERNTDLDASRFDKACDTLREMMIDCALFVSPGESISKLEPKSHRFVNRETFEQTSSRMAELTASFLGFMKLAEIDQAEVVFKQIESLVLEMEELPVDLIRGLVGDLIYEAKRQFIQAGLDAYSCTAEAGDLIEGLSAVENREGLVRFLSRLHERMRFLSGQRTKDPDDLLVERASTYIEEHLRESLTRESVAEAIGISPSRFSRLVQQKKGRTFTDLLNQYRIERAALLLVRSSDSLAEIAGETGFCDQSYFSKVFRKYKELSPSAYREAHRG